MQVIEVGVRNQNEIDGRKIRDAKARTAKPLQYEQPPGKIRIDQHALSSNLYEEAGMTDKSDAQFSVGGEARFVSLHRPRSNRRMAHQTSELGGALAESRIAKRLLDHPATGHGLKRIVMAPSYYY